MRADSGIIYFDNHEVLIYLFKAGNLIFKPEVTSHHKIVYLRADGIEKDKSILQIAEKLIDIVASDQASGVYRWKIIFKNEASILFDEIKRILDFEYEVLTEAAEQRLICAGLICEFL